jgi:hypothetical protein
MVDIFAKEDYDLETIDLETKYDRSNSCASRTLA